MAITYQQEKDDPYWDPFRLEPHPWEIDALISATSVDNECVHGSLPFDPQVTCRCWERE